MKTLTTVLILCFLSGCASMTNKEMVWQGLHAIDVLQTIDGPAYDPCKMEINPITQKFLGEHPSTEQVLLWGVLWGTAHWKITDWVDNSKLPNWFKITYNIIDFGGKTITIINNEKNGTRLGRKNAASDPLNEICYQELGYGRHF